MSPLQTNFKENIHKIDIEGQKQIIRDDKKFKS